MPVIWNRAGKPYGVRRTVITLSLLLLYTPDIGFAKEKPKLFDDLLSVSFADGMGGWACGRWGVILHTSDGGVSWTPQNSGTEHTLTSVCFVDVMTGWAVGDGGTIIHTANGGESWEHQESPVSYVLMDVHFVTPLKGWVVGERTHILYTEDGGKTWGVQFSGEDFILKGVSFYDELRGWAVGEFGFIYHTSDGGVTWQKQGGYFGFSEETLAPEGDPYLFDVTVLGPKTVWAVGIDGYVTKTEDGGITWEEVSTGAPKTQLFGIAGDPNGTIHIAGRGIFLTSVDGGYSWQQPVFEPYIRYSWLYGLSPRGSEGFVAVGQKGAIYLSAEEGWRKIGF